MKGKLTDGARLAQIFPKFAPYISTELTITELIDRRDYADDVTLQISSKDLDPAFEPAETQKTYGRGQDPVAYERGVGKAGANPDDENNRDSAHPISGIAQAFQSMGEDGCSIQVIRHSQPRKNAPEWIVTSLGEFIRSRLTVQQRTTKYVPLQEQLNFHILHDYYLEKYKDKTIFRRYLHQFKRDRAGSRWTSSVFALKARRERLIAAGNAFFGVDRARQQEENAEPSCNNTRGIFRRLDSGAGGFFKTCAVPGCLNQGEASGPVVDGYICEQHPRSIQRKTSALQKLKTVSLPRMPYVEGSSSLPANDRRAIF